MIVSKNLTFKYSDSVVFNFPDIVCKPGDKLLITGNSGKGKTTLLHLLAGFLKPTSGEILINDQNIAALNSSKLDLFRGQNIGVILQQNHFIASISVLENIMLSSWLVSQKEKKKEAQILLDKLDLLAHQNKLPSQLSVGQQQRASIARALINNPSIILADEPTSSLDDENTIKVSKLLNNLSDNFNATLIIVTHDQRLKNVFHNSIEL